MEALIANIQQFLNDATTIKVLNALVLIMVLVWLLTGFRFLERRPGRKRGRKDGEDER